MTPRRPRAAILVVAGALAVVYALTMIGGGPPGPTLGAIAGVTGVLVGFSLCASTPTGALLSAYLGLHLMSWAAGPVGGTAIALAGGWGLAVGLFAGGRAHTAAFAALAAVTSLGAWAGGLVTGGAASAWALGVGVAGAGGIALRRLGVRVSQGSEALGLAPPPLSHSSSSTPTPVGTRVADPGAADGPVPLDTADGRPWVSPRTEVSPAPTERAAASQADPPAGRTTRIEAQDAAATDESLAQGPGGPVREDAPVGLERTLRALRSELRAGRAVVWSVSTEDRVATPSVAEGGPMPPVTSVEGDPLLWAARETSALRADRPPRWAPDARAAGIAYAGELEGVTSVLTLEFKAPDRLPDLSVLEHAGARVAASLRLEAAEDEAGERVRHAAAVLDATRRIATRLDPAEIAEELCGAAVRLVGEGAALASWTGDGGVVLGASGDLGGPAAGDAILAPDSQMAIAARSEAPIRRSRGGRGDGPPVARPGERWAAPWRDLVVFPLTEPDAGTIAVLAVWAREAGGLREDGLRWLEGVSGVAAAQLRNADRYEELRADAEFDELTGLLNRRAFDNRFEVESARFERYQRPVALLLLDLDHFKDVNDRFGHAVGDRALSAVARAIGRSVRGADIAARIGGEEFGVLLPETRVREAVEVADRVRTAVAGLDLRHEGTSIPLRISVGVSACPDCVDGGGRLRESADAALYEAKRGGRDRVAVAESPRIPNPGPG